MPDPLVLLFLQASGILISICPFVEQRRTRLIWDRRQGSDSEMCIRDRDGMGDPPVDNMGAAHPPADRLHAAVDFRDHAAGNDAAFFQALYLADPHLSLIHI